MSHTDPEILALRALGETAGTAHDAEHAAIHKGWHYIKISGIVLTLTSAAASALDAHPVQAGPGTRHRQHPAALLSRVP